MQKSIRQILSGLLVLAMVLGLIPTSVLAEEDSPTAPFSEITIGDVPAEVGEDERLEILSLPASGATVNISDNGDYPWVRNGNRLQSKSQAQSNTSSETTISFTLDATCRLSFDYGAYSQYEFDKLTITLNNETVVNAISDYQAHIFRKVLEPGSYSLTLRYTKGSSIYYNNGFGYIENFVLTDSFTVETIADGKCGDDISWVLTNDGTLTISGTGNMASSYSYSTPWYDYRSQITTVVIGDGVTSITDRAFFSCRNLANVTISDSVTSIGISTFEACNSLIRITIPDSVTSIGSSAFSGCSGLISVTIPDSVTSIGSAAFYECSSLTSVTIPDSVTSIGSSAFFDCSSLASVTIPNSVTSIGSKAFYGCRSLTGIWVAEDNQNYYSDKNGVLFDKAMTTLIRFPCRYKDERDVEYTIPNSVTEIESYAFENCRTLFSVTIPDSVTKIGYYAFCDCILLGNVFIYGNNLTIEDGAFYDCECLTSIFFYGNAPLFSGNPFTGVFSAFISYPANDRSWSPHVMNDYGGRWLTWLPIGTHEHQYQAWVIQPTCTESGYTEYYCYCEYSYDADEVPPLGHAWDDGKVTQEAGEQDGVMTFTCTRCDETRTEAIPATNPIIDQGQCGENAFWKLTQEGTLTIYGAGPMTDYTYSVQAPWYKHRNQIRSVEIENGVTSIGAYAFYYCYSLTNVTIPDSVTSTGVSAFSYCRSLTGITIPDSVTSIERATFLYCDRLTDITIPDGVTSIGDSAFSYCMNLTSITIPDSVTSIGDYAFLTCRSLTEVTIPDSVTSIGYCAFSSCESLTGIWVAKDNQNYCSDKDGALFDKSMTTLIRFPCTNKDERDVEYTIPNSVTKIERYAFENCNTLLSVTIPDSVTKIGTNAFRKCVLLGNVFIYGNDVDIESNVFDGCECLISIHFYGDYPLCSRNSFAGITGAMMFYPANNPTWSILNDYGGQQLTWLPDGTHEHQYLIRVTQPTCTEGGYTAYFCYCGYSYVADEVPPLGHAWDEGKITQEAGTLDSVLTYTCTRCGKTKMGELPDASLIIAHGQCGENAYWKFSEDGTLTIYGTGAIKDYSGFDDNRVPWYNYRSWIKTTVIEKGITIIGQNAFDHCSSMTDIVIPDSVTTIGASAFKNCSSLISLTIPDSVTDIGLWTFDECSSLTGIWVSENNPEFCSDENGVLYTKSMDYLVQCPATYTGAYQIPNSVRSIGPDAFRNCKGLTHVTIPDSVTVINMEAFQFCTSLTDLVLPDSVVYIDPYSFYGCYNLTSLTIPGKVTSISHEAFAGCSRVTTITFVGDAPSFGEDSFYAVTATAYYPANNPTWTAEVMNDHGGTITWVPYGVSQVFAITKQPEIYVGPIGSTASFHVEVSGEGLTYQWYYSPDNVGWSASGLTGNKTDTLQVAFTASRAGQFYRCEISNSKGEKLTTDAVFMCEKLPPITIQQQPESFMGKSGETGVFQVKASGEELTYQWYYSKDNGVTWSKSGQTGSTTDTMNIQLTMARAGQCYRCEIRDADGNVFYSDQAAIKLETENIEIKYQPVSANGYIGETTTFHVEATGMGLTYQWYYSKDGGRTWSPSGMAGFNTDTLKVQLTAARVGQSYRCAVTDNKGNTVYSNVVAMNQKISVVGVLEIQQQPKDFTGKVGDTAVFYVDAIGENLVFQWQFSKDGKTWEASGLPGSKTDTLRVEVTAARIGQHYRCVITDAKGKALISNPVTLYQA